MLKEDTSNIREYPVILIYPSLPMLTEHTRPDDWRFLHLMYFVFWRERNYPKSWILSLRLGKSLVACGGGDGGGGGHLTIFSHWNWVMPQSTFPSPNITHPPDTSSPLAMLDSHTTHQWGSLPANTGTFFTPPPGGGHLLPPLLCPALRTILCRVAGRGPANILP